MNPGCYWGEIDSSKFPPPPPPPPLNSSSEPFSCVSKSKSSSVSWSHCLQSCLSYQLKASQDLSRYLSKFICTVCPNKHHQNSATFSVQMICLSEVWDWFIFWEEDACTSMAAWFEFAEEVDIRVDSKDHHVVGPVGSSIRELCGYIVKEWICYS